MIAHATSGPILANKAKYTYAAFVNQFSMHGPSVASIFTSEFIMAYAPARVRRSVAATHGKRANKSAAEDSMIYAKSNTRAMTETEVEEEEGEGEDGEVEMVSVIRKARAKKSSAHVFMTAYPIHARRHSTRSVCTVRVRTCLPERPNGLGRTLLGRAFTLSAPNSEIASSKEAVSLCT